MKLIKVIVFIILVFVVVIIIYSSFWIPSTKEARRLVISFFHYSPPIAAKLIFSKNYWASFDYIEPRSICLGFQYSQQDIIDFNNFNFSENNRDDAYYSSYPVADDKGCAKLINSRNNIKKHFRYSERLQGGTIFVDVKNKIVIFEIYLFD